MTAVLLTKKYRTNLQMQTSRILSRVLFRLELVFLHQSLFSLLNEIAWVTRKKKVNQFCYHDMFITLKTIKLTLRNKDIALPINFSFSRNFSMILVQAVLCNLKKSLPI